MVKASEEWRAHVRSDADFIAEAERAERAFRQSLERVRRLATPGRFQAAHRLYEASAELYVQTARVYRWSVGLEDPTQMDLLARRLRELADRVFDRGRASLGFPLRSDTPAVDVKLPEDVPIWTAEGLAPGPPLDEEPPLPATSPPLREDERRQHARKAWERDVQRAGAPALGELRKVIDGGDPGRQRDIARRFINAAEQMRGRPDPRNEREASARLRLSWLVAADAARAAQCVSSFGAMDLADVAKHLANVPAMIYR